MADTVLVGRAVVDKTNRSAVSWPAILAGGIAAAARSLLLLAFGSGLRLSVVSPWPDRGISSSAAPIAAIAAGIYLVLFPLDVPVPDRHPARAGRPLACRS